MAEIKKFIDDIESASNGSEVRTTIIDALTSINDNCENSEKLGGQYANYYVTVDQLKEATSFDTEPTEDSTKAVSSGGLYKFYTEVTNLLASIRSKSSVTALPSV